MAEYTRINPSTMLCPTPVVLVSCGEKDHPENRNLVTVAWAGTVNSEPPMVSVSLRKERYSHGLISGSGEFVVNLVDEALAKATDFCGRRFCFPMDFYALTTIFRSWRLRSRKAVISSASRGWAAMRARS